LDVCDADRDESRTHRDQPIADAVGLVDVEYSKSRPRCARPRNIRDARGDFLRAGVSERVQNGCSSSWGLWNGAAGGWCGAAVDGRREETGELQTIVYRMRNHDAGDVSAIDRMRRGLLEGVQSGVENGRRPYVCQRRPIDRGLRRRSTARGRGQGGARLARWAGA